MIINTNDLFKKIKMFYNTKKSNSLCYFGKYFMQKIQRVSDRRCHDSLFTWGIMSLVIRSYFYIVHKICVKIIKWGGLLGLIQGPSRLLTYIKHWSTKKNETKDFNPDGTTGFLEIISFFNNFVDSIVLCLHYQLPFL